MTPQETMRLRRQLPERMSYPYYAGREDAWLMAQHLAEETQVAAWKAGPYAKLLHRPLVRPVVAGCGGVLAPRDFHALAYAGQTSGWAGLSPAAWTVLERIYAEPWVTFEVTFGLWANPRGNRFLQTSRAGLNLVLQLGFPAEHGALMGRYLGSGARKRFEYALHPVRRTGTPTLAWARLDVDVETGTVLIEELQSDWLRFVRKRLTRLQRQNPRSHEARTTAAYEARLRTHYGKIWPRALLLCVLECIREFIGRAEVFLHQPAPGAALKRIGGRPPPVSLYSALPRSFAFAPTQEAPRFLAKPRKRDLARLGRGGVPLFWRMAF